MIVSIALFAVSGHPRPAQAQIYSWRDANGVPTFSDQPRDAGARAVRVPVGPVSFVERTNPPVEALIRQYAKRLGIRPDLVRAVIQVESGFDPRAVSPKGAIGLMQLMPATAREFGVIDPFNPAENIRGGVSYLRQLLDRYDDNEQLALAAYNAGPGAVGKYGNNVPPYKETQHYVKKITTIRGNVRPAPGATIYKIVDTVDGRTVVKYTNARPGSGRYDIVGRPSVIE